jgi:imidazole glycerol-phosphate synthase subunit HisH
MIAIIDYEMGNLRSVQKAFEHVGHAAVITSDPAVLADAEKIVLPGVGAFCDAIAALRQRKLVEPVRAAIEGGKPFLGICLGLQMLFDKGYEDGEHEGLGILPGEVVRFKVPAEFKVPHMGWNQLRIRRRPPILNGIEDGAHFYFVHSYYVVRGTNLWLPPRPSILFRFAPACGATICLLCSSIRRRVKRPG